MKEDMQKLDLDEIHPKKRDTLTNLQNATITVDENNESKQNFMSRRDLNRNNDQNNDDPSDLEENVVTENTVQIDIDL